ncbi:hypothetical protein CYMTET_12676 [Cymbomonas tetramitiformis]|uniref:Uncharacterized protein n=1 Tax=Cymbomonas tetramitiformis TaxID=36881 RepID=A0AAE0GJU4_9CHLO|nr:hypothetical protein CYMTET_12676 [Cymbomonas tetramitiformis]
MSAASEEAGSPACDDAPEETRAPQTADPTIEPSSEATSGNSVTVSEPDHQPRVEKPGVPVSQWKGYPHNLDFGIYWVGPGNKLAKSQSGVENPYFDKNRENTVVYTHGLGTNRVEQGYRNTFNYKANDPKFGLDICTADAWIEQGWNVGIFYWDQFADEQNPFDAEAKIWTAESPKGMRYKLSDGQYHKENLPPSACVSDMLVIHLAAALGTYTGSIRLAGHALGAQVMLRVARLIFDKVEKGKLPMNLTPRRIALLDPFFSRKMPVVNPQKFMKNNFSVAVKCFHYTKYMREKGVLFELYRTSIMGSASWPHADPNTDLCELVALAEIGADYIPVYETQSRHLACPNIYFHSLSAPPPAVYNGETRAEGVIAPSASSSDAEIYAYMQDSKVQKFVQSHGRESFSLKFRGFSLRSCAPRDLLEEATSKSKQIAGDLAEKSKAQLNVAQSKTLELAEASKVKMEAAQVQTLKMAHRFQTRWSQWRIQAAEPRSEAPKAADSMSSANVATKAALQSIMGDFLWSTKEPTAKPGTPEQSDSDAKVATSDAKFDTSAQVDQAAKKEDASESAAEAPEGKSTEETAAPTEDAELSTESK